MFLFGIHSFAHKLLMINLLPALIYGTECVNYVTILWYCVRTDKDLVNNLG